MFCTGSKTLKSQFSKVSLSFLFVFFVGLFFTSNVKSQTQIFNVAGGGAFLTGWAGVNNVTTNAINMTSYYLVDAGATSDIITTATYDLSAYSSATLDLKVATFGSGSNNPAKIEISYNGGTSYTQVATSATPTSSTYINGGPINLSSVSSQVKIRISNNVTSGKGVRLQNLILTAYSSPTSPLITATPTTLTGFTYGFGSGPSNTQTTSVSGTNLVDNITLTAPAGYEISFSSGSGFGTTLTLNHTGGTVNATTIYVRLKAGLATGNYNTQNIVCSSSTAPNVNITCSGTVTAPVPIVDLASSNPAISVGNITQNTTSNVIYAFTLSGSVANASLTALSFTTSYTGTNVTNLKLFYSADNIFNSGTDVLLKTIAAPGASGLETFSAITHTVTSGTTGYYFISCDVSCMIAGNTIAVAALTTANLTFTSATKTGSAFAGGTQTIIHSSPAIITGLTTSLCQNTGTTLSWTAPLLCSSEVLVFAKASAFSAAIPTGDGSAYTANTVFGGGTAFDGGFCVYKGTGATVNISGLTMGTTYTFKVFTRNGNNWSAGVTVTCTPTIGYCTAASTNTGFEYIQGIIIDAISGTTSNTTSNTTYSDYTSTITTVTRNETFPVTIYNGDYYASDIIKIWIDFNQDGDFVDAGETVFTSVAGASAPYVANITIPAGASLGNTRMRIRMYDSSAGTSNSTPCGTHTYGEVEDYTLNIVNPCVPTHSISSFAPISGPVGTYVTIIGSGFTAGSNVYFDGVLATTVEFVSATKLIARVPAGAQTGIIKITESACYVISASDFTIIEESGSCLTSSGPGYTDLFISEVYDSDAGNVAYIEIYNPTSSPINLATLNYAICIDNQTAASVAISCDRTIALSGTVPANSVFLLNLGTSSNTCVKDWDFTAGGNGFNAFDNIVLIRNGVQVDRVNLPNNTGYSYLRNLTATAPTMTFALADWSTSNVEDCAHLGVGPVSTYVNPVLAINNSSSCQIDLSVVVTEGDATPTGDLTYKWYYNNGTDATWTQVSAVLPAGYTITGQTSNNLEIISGTNYISDLNEYQFYCEVIEAGTCANVSTASLFDISERPIYRSIAGSNGNWTTITNWQMAYSTAGPWVAACNYPRSANSSQAIIQIGTNIVLDIDNDIDMLTIDGILEISPNSQLTVYDSVPAGADLILNGTLLYRANAANQMVLTGTTTWIFNAGASFIKTNTADPFMFRDKYQGGMSSIPATGSWIYRNNNDGNPYTGTVNFFYPNLYIENTGGTGNFAFNSSQIAFNGSSGFATVKGNMYVGTTGTGSVTIYNNNINSNPMLILGNLEVAANSIFSNELCATCGAASATINHGTGVELKGNLAVGGTLQILNGSTERVLRFTGTTIQTVSGAGTITLYKVTVDKASEYVDLLRNLQARNELKMVQGHIYTHANMFELGYTTAQLGTLTYTSGYIVGRMRRWFLGTNAGDPTGLFPMGWNDSGLKNRFARVFFNDAPTAGGHLTVEFIPIDMGTAGLVIPQANTGGFGMDVTSTENQGYWKIDNEPTKLVDGTYRIACTGEGFITINDLAEITLLKRVGGGDWFCPAIHEPATGTIAMPTCSRIGVSNWSNFGFGGGGGTLLPIELTDFSVNCASNEIEVSWQTSSERNNDYFTLEHSFYGDTFNEIGIIKGAGNSSSLNNYEFLTEQNAGYLRLKQTDFNGNSSYSKLIEINCDANEFLVYPNPTSNLITLKYSSAEKIILYNQLGQIVREFESFKENVTLNLEGLSDGFYHLNVISTIKNQYQKIELKR